jgi:eukaryotic-like serine/threonine-protein kinase
VAFAVENICGFLIRGGLMTPDEMRAMYQRWQAEAGADMAHLQRFLKWLVATDYVTEYQAGLLAQGHADNFFLNQYKILERIGRGRMAGVYKAVHSMGQVVAIKVLPPSRAKDPQLLARFEREARLAVRLNHANVVRTFQVGETDGLHYLVMEHLEGETLEDLLRRRPVLRLEEAVQLAYQTLLGLQHIHEQGMVHRDIKPANLFLVSPTAIKILDIGLAREFFEDTPGGAPDGLDLTAEGMLLGTPDYLAPDQARDPRRSDIRADIYSVGCVLYHMLVGQPPFPDRSLFRQIVRHATEAPRPLRSHNPAIPDGLEQIVAWMMAKRPEDRYAAPSRAAQALHVFLLACEPATDMEMPPMREFLNWLEREESTPHAASSAAPPAKTIKQAQPVPVAPLAEMAQPALKIDVELVPTPAPLPGSTPAPLPPRVPPAPRLTAAGNQRLFIIIAVAAVIAVVSSCAAILGWLIRGLLG